MPVKLTMFFSLNRSAWSEAYLLNVSNSEVLPQGATDFVNTRCSLLGVGAELFALRLSNFPANRAVNDVDVSIFTSSGSWPTGMASIYNAAEPNVAVLVKCGSGGAGSKNIYLAGCPTGLVRASGGPQINLFPANPTGWASLFKNFQKALTSGLIGYRTWLTTLRVQSLGLQSGPQVPPLIGVQLPTVQAWTVGQKVLLGGWRRVNPRAAGLSGIYTLAGVPPAGQVGPPYVYYLLNTSQVNPTNFKSIGTVGLATFSFTAITSANLDEGTTRKRGGRVFLPVGRSSARR